MELHLIEQASILPDQFEVIERKGFGHPDTLSDGLAEAVSMAYAAYTTEHFGAVLHHNFDKVGLLGGNAHVTFGDGRLTAPIRVLLNGRATLRFGEHTVPLNEILEEATKSFLHEKLEMIDPDRDLEFHHNISTASSPGHIETDTRHDANRKAWFHPSGLEDLRERTVLQSNDTSVGCGFWPLTPTESMVLDLEGMLTSKESRKERPWLGTDIKVMACRVGSTLNLTLCIPQIANHVPSAAQYRENLEVIREVIRSRAQQHLPSAKIEVWLNTKDNFDIPELYMTAIGSSIESGDEGLVGRGNRVNGLIAMGRPYSMEGACGKNPIYHVGKLYYVHAIDVAKRIYEAHGTPANVFLIGQEGRMLTDPWQAIVQSEKRLSDHEVIPLIEASLATLTQTTEGFLRGEVRLF